MVLQRDAEEVRDVAERRRAHVPRRARHLDGALKPDRRHSDPVEVAARAEDTLVELGVVSGDEVHVVEERGHARPKLGERRRSANGVEVAVQVRELETLGRRANEAVCALDDRAVIHPHEPDRAGARRVGVRGLEVERREGEATRGATLRSLGSVRGGMHASQDGDAKPSNRWSC